jgi:hypothetical protein
MASHSRTDQLGADGGQPDQQHAGHHQRFGVQHRPQANRHYGEPRREDDLDRAQSSARSRVHAEGAERSHYQALAGDGGSFGIPARICLGIRAFGAAEAFEGAGVLRSRIRQHVAR